MVEYILRDSEKTRIEEVLNTFLEEEDRWTIEVH